MIEWETQKNRKKKIHSQTSCSSRPVRLPQPRRMSLSSVDNGAAIFIHPIAQVPISIYEWADEHLILSNPFDFAVDFKNPTQNQTGNETINQKLLCSLGTARNPPFILSKQRVRSAAMELQGAHNLAVDPIEPEREYNSLIEQYSWFVFWVDRGTKEINFISLGKPRI